MASDCSEFQPQAPSDVSGSANTILYVGLAMVALGLLLTFVGLEEFKTVDLKLVGPSLVGCGVFFALLRILFCSVPSFLKNCFTCCHRKEDSEKLLDEESIGEEEVLARVRTAVARNGKLKPLREPVNTMINKSKSENVDNVDTHPQLQHHYDHQQHHHDQQQHPHDQQLFHYDEKHQPWHIGDDEEPRSRLPKLHMHTEGSNINIFGGEDPLSYSLSSAFSLRDLQLDIRPGIVQRGNNFFTNKF